MLPSETSLPASIPTTAFIIDLALSYAICWGSFTRNHHMYPIRPKGPLGNSLKLLLVPQG